MGFFDFLFGGGDLKEKIKKLIEEVLVSKDRFKNSKDDKANKFCFYIHSRLKNCRNENEYNQIKKDWKDFLKQFDDYEESEYTPNPDFYNQSRFRDFHIVTPDFYSTSNEFSSTSNDLPTEGSGEFSGGGASSSWENSDSNSGNFSDNS
jgi:hypothetical protein